MEPPRRFYIFKKDSRNLRGLIFSKKTVGTPEVLHKKTSWDLREGLTFLKKIVGTPEKVTLKKDIWCPREGFTFLKKTVGTHEKV